MTLETPPQRDSEELYQALFEQAADGIFITNADGHFIEVNRHGCEMLGYTRAEILSLSMEDFIPDEDQETDPLDIDALRAGKTVLKERRLRGKDSRLVPVEISTRMLTDGRFLGIVRDITERKQMQEEHQAHLWFLESLDRVNRAMQKTNDIEQMMSDVLDIILTVFECDRAWLVYPCDPETDFWEIPMERSRPEYPGLSVPGLKMPVTPQIIEIMRLANTLSGSVTYGPGSAYEIPSEIQTFGVQSTITTVFHPKSSKPWMFGLHQCSYPRIWTASEERLFQEVSRRMADSLTSLLAYRDLRESQDKLAEAERIAHVGYWDFDIEQGRVNLSNEACRIFGLQLQKHSFDITFITKRIHPEDLPRLEQTRDESLQAKRYYDLEYRVIRPNGDIRFIHSRSNVVRSETGQTLRLFGTIQDVTKRRRAEDELRASEARFRTFVDHATDAFFLHDDQGKVIDVNRQACESLGYTREELIGMTPDNYDIVVDKALIKQIIDRLNAGEIVAFESKHRRKDGTIFPVEVRARPLQQDNRRLGIALVRDITERKQLEAENEKLTAQFYQAQRMESIGQLAGGIAHDFNNLLIPIMGYIELNLAELDSRSKLYADLTQVRKAADRAADLTRQILAFSRQQVLEMSLLDLNSLIVDFQKMLQRLLGEDIELQIFLAPGLVPIKADKSQIEQVILNLAVNARDAMSSGGKLTIETTNAYLDETYVEKYAGNLAAGHYVMLAVSDTGQGIDAVTQKRIFDPFFTTKEQGQGTGLGLSTVFGIIKQHQGHILVYSESSNGTTFKIYLPKAEEIPQSIISPTTKPITVFGTETVLVVEDEEMVRKLVCETLEAHGYDVLEALSPADGLKLASDKSTIHLLVTDVIMPEMNGKALYNQVTALQPNCKVLYMSGYTNNVIVHHGILDEGINFLQKPFTIHNLVRKVRHVLS